MKLIGDKSFYKRVFKIAIPLMIQNGVTNMVGLINNITVGQLGTEQLAGVAIANQLISIFYLMVFGVASATGIFGAQYEGKKDYEGARNVFRLKILLMVFFCTAAILIFTIFGRPLISAFLHDNNDGSDLTLTLNEGYKYLLLMCIGFLPYGIGQAYAGSLREAGHTMAPMRSSVIALIISLGLNLLLIPMIGVAGAAVATVVSRFVEGSITIFWTHRNQNIAHFIVHAYRTFKVPAELTKSVVIKGAPLILNESLWSVGLTIVNQSYSYRGVTALAAVNMASTIVNLVNVLFMTMGVVIGIIMGNMLGADTPKEEVRDTNTKLIATSVGISLGVAAILFALGPVFPLLYKSTSSEVKEIAKYLIWAEACGAPFRAFGNAAYYTIRSGGKTLLTALYDCGFVWYALVPIAYCLAHFTELGIIPMYFTIKMAEGIKCLIGFIMVKRGKWMTNIVDRQTA